MNYYIKTVLNININNLKKFNLNKLFKLQKSSQCIFNLSFMLYNI